MSGARVAGRELGREDLEAAVLGGLLLSSGGTGVASSARHRGLGEDALARGKVRLLPLEQFAADDALLVATAVGAPGAAGARTRPQDAIDAALALQAACGRRLAGVMASHVPGMYTWTIAAGLGIPLADAATNGRAHPTERMGGMGLAADPAATIWQAGHSAGGPGEPPLSVLVHGHPNRTSQVLRAAAVQNGGLINAVRGPFDADFVRRRGAPGSISFALGLGEAMRAAQGPARVAAAAAFLGGEVLIEGEVAANAVAYAAGFEVGTLTVRAGTRRVTLGVYNEFMTAEEDGRRISSFPDFLGSLDPASGDPVSIMMLTPGTPVAIVAAARARIPLGAGVFDASVYAEAEAAMGMELAKFALSSHAAPEQ